MMVFLALLVAGLADDGPTPAPKPTRGLLNWGLGLEAPLVGPLGDIPSGSQASWGYSLGAGLFYSVTPQWQVRFAGAKTRTTNGRGYVSFASGVERGQLAEVEQWEAWLVSVGTTYVGTTLPALPVAPYFGVDFVWGYGGYSYHYDDNANGLLASPATQSALAPPNSHAALGWLFGAGLRAGAQLELCPWLHTLSEIGLIWLPVGGIALTNNRDIRDVRTASQIVFLPYFQFGVRAAL